MKTSVQAFFASTLAAIVLSTSAFATSTDSLSIQKVIVKGNAKVILIQKDQESVRIDGNSHDHTTVKTKGKSLVITSNEEQPATIIVYVKKPFRVEASNTSTVETSGKFNVDFLQVVLKDQAKANINAATKGLYTLVNDQSKLKLSGTSDEHISIRSKASKLQMDNLASNKTSSTYFETAGEKLASNTPAASKVTLSRR
jgi:hypothetical protein